MNELKINLLYKILFFLFILFLIRAFTVSTKYLQDETEITGTILSITEKEDQINYIVKAKERILISLKGKNTFKLGDTVTFKGVLEYPKKSTNFHLFSYKNYLLSKKIFWIMNASSSTLKKKNSNVLFTIKNYIIKRIECLEKKEYYYAFLLGDTSKIDNQVKTSYQQNGISHLFAISGMHITFLSVILLSILKKFCSFKTSILLMLPFFLFYLFLTNFSPSVVRATFLFFACAFKKIYHFSYSSKQALIILFLILLCINPYYLYNTGFLFSFTISFFLIHFQKLCRQKSKIKNLLMTSFVAFLAGLPIQLINFFECNFLSIFFNLFFVPLVSNVIFPFSFLSFFFPVLDSLFSVLILWLERSSIFLSTITLGRFFFPYNPFFVFLTIILIFYCLTKLKSRKNVFYLLFIFLLFYYHSAFLNPTTVTFLDVGQGDSTLISLNHNKGNILIDTGGSLLKKGEISDRTLLPVLKSKGIHSLQLLILTHGDADHMGEAINLIKNFKVEHVIFNCGAYNSLERELIEELEMWGINYDTCIKKWDTDSFKLQFLNTGVYDNENDNSSVIYFDYNNYQFLFMGDAGIEREKDILNKYNLSSIDFLKVGHHGSDTSSSKGFINSISPKYSIISVGKNNRYGHPNKEVLEKLDESKIYRTDIDGSVMLKIKNNKLKIETCPP